MSQTVRIIGGKYRGKKLAFPLAEGLRPTPSRVRETLFNWLMHKVRGARCLDAFAGSGALGLEAFSRGAKEVVLVEASPLVCSHLKKVLAFFPKEGLSLYSMSALTYLSKGPEPFDLIFLDPPFASAQLQECLVCIQKNSLLTEGGLIYVESNSPLSTYQSLFSVLKEQKAGQVYYGLLQF